MNRVKCMAAFGVVLCIIGLIVWACVMVPVLLVLTPGALVATWGITTTIDCLTSEGD